MNAFSILHLIGHMFYWHNTTLRKTDLSMLILERRIAEGIMRYVPSPIPIQYDFMYSAMANHSGRMQYHKVRPGLSKLRISRTEFIKAYNEAQIVALRPLPQRSQESVFQLEFYI